MNELQIVEMIRRLCSGQDQNGLVQGIGDDCAVLRPSPDEDLLATTDFLIEGVHFLASAARASDVGWKALARGLSDIAAMGGTPRYCLVSLGLSPATPPKYVREFYRGLLQLAGMHEVRVIGGDLTQTRQFTVDVVVMGGVARGEALRRDTAQRGDLICVTGMLGGAELGLETEKGAAWRRHLRPQPRVKEIAALRRAVPLRACMDLSDGLALDLHRMCLASGLAADLDWRLPLFPGASLRHAVLGGDDYELLFTVPEGTELPESVAGVMLTAIGRMVEGKPGAIRLAKNLLNPEGWDPFQRKPRARRPRSR